MDITFIQDTKHEVDRHQGCRDQNGLTREGVLKCLRHPLKAAADGGRHAHLSHGLPDLCNGVSQRYAGREIERDGDSWKQSLVIDRERCGGGRIMCERAEWHQCIVGALYIEILEAIGILTELRLHL